MLARLAALPEHGPEWRGLAQRLTIGETYFFRNDGCFDALTHEILPRLIAARRHAEGRPRLSMWSAGCSTGEEPYSLAILLDRMLPDIERWDVSILATDVNLAALEVARAGVYRPWSLRATPTEVRHHYFVRRGDAFTLRHEARGRVDFAPLSLTGDTQPAASSIDLLLCRNVLMYLAPAMARRAIAHLRTALAPDGWLAVAPAEAGAQSFRPLQPVYLRGAIFFTHPAVAATCDALPPAVAAPGPAPAPASRPARLHPPAARRAPPARQENTLQRARALADRGQLAEARHACEDVLAGDPLEAGAHRLMAEILQEAGDLPQAIAALRRAVYLAPDAAEGHAALGQLLLRQGQLRQGRRHLETAARLGARPAEAP
jgi:chemotaxis protein methyltransferase CheR